MRPLISICIPTHNRADLLDYCLSKLAPLNDCGWPIEVVVSDNGSTDRTPEVISAHRDRIAGLRDYRFPENRGPTANALNALHRAAGELAVYLADDDTLIVENLLRHAETMEKQGDLVAIYADWIAWDDQAEREIHRHYEGLTGTMTFGPQTPLDLVNFMLKRFYPPETGIYRREPLLRSFGFWGRNLPFYERMYRLSRFGRVIFDPLPFYREHRVLKDRFKRTAWLNIAMQHHMIGDELRLALESMVLLGTQDAGGAYLTADRALEVRNDIDRILHARLRLEIDRACGRKDWIMAVELRRRQVLWHGPGPDQEMKNDVLKIVFPAALQAVRQTYQSLSGAPGIVLRGFETAKVAEFFTSQFPDTPILPADAHINGGTPPLIVHRDERTLAQDNSLKDRSSVMILEQQLDVYRIARTRIELRGF